jgi:hypothetical protein
MPYVSPFYPQITTEMETARSFAQQADARITEAEARSTAATAKCDEETARSRELQVTLGLQAHQVSSVTYYAPQAPD